MIERTELAQLSAPRRAELIYQQARSELSDRLWRAALGNVDGGRPEPMAEGGRGNIGLQALLTLMDDQKSVASAPPTPQPFDRALATQVNEPSMAPVSCDTSPKEQLLPKAGRDEVVGLGPNLRHRPALTSAASRTGIPVSALATMIDAEAAKDADGSWLVHSRNPRSSAAGLGQFLSGTWEHMAETKGTWLNGVARSKGWLGDRGNLIPAARSFLLSLRYDPVASINSVADYAQMNLNGLRKAGITVGTEPDSIARAAYMGHHLGLGDAIRFLKGGLDPSRAEMLLRAQIGTTKANQGIEKAGNASLAHRSWLLGYVDRNIRPSRMGV